MQARFRTSLLLIFWTLSLTACVSVSVKPPTITKSTEFKFQAPGKPFEKMNNDQADQAWQNPKNSNTIAVLTECSSERDPALSSLEGDVLQALNNYKVLSSKEFQFQERAAIRTQAEGNVDGVPVQLDFAVFKKKGCSYTLTYVGKSDGFEQDRATFEKFLTRFEVP